MSDSDNIIFEEFTNPSDEPITQIKPTEEIWHDMCGEESSYEVD